MRRIPKLAAVLMATAGCTASTSLPSVEAGLGVCRLPATVTSPTMEVVDPVDVVVSPTAYHVLALTWSPAWCAVNGARPSETFQCVDNRFGWVLHGLWPNAETAPHPRFCRPATQTAPSTLRRHLCRIPSVDLIQHEWAAHGVCAWPTPEAYLADAGTLWERLRRPDPADLAGADRRVSVGDLRSAFARLNPGLAPDAVAVGATDAGGLREVRICHDLALRPRACPDDARGLADDRILTVTPVPART